MNIMEIGICTNNNDPKGLGRIRYIPYTSFTSEVENSLTYQEWDENDIFISYPFLPPHINLIPEVRQAVKLLKYDTEKMFQRNVEYITGPFTSPHDFENESFSSQVGKSLKNGSFVKPPPDLKTKEGQYKDKRSENSMINPEDYGFYGKYGSDLIFTKNGVTIRGGKLVSKDSLDKTTRKVTREIPLVSEKVSKLTLKKFPSTLKQDVPKLTTETSLEVDRIKFIVEYDLDDLTTPTELKIYVYEVLKNTQDKFKTNKFDLTTEFDYTDKNLIKIHNDNSINGNGETVPSVIIPITSIEMGGTLMRNFLVRFREDGLYAINNTGSKTDIHPFYFKPTNNLQLNNVNNTIKTTFFNDISLYGILIKNGLVFSKKSIEPYFLTKEIKQSNYKSDNIEQTFASLTSDFLVLLSTTATKGGNLDPINFKELNQYEYTQDDFIKKILPNTYSLIRGENLIKLLNLMYEILVSHVHNINLPTLYKEDKMKELSDLIKTMEVDLLSNTIRIN